ncbi:MAG: hypothetical protein MK207_02895 [Saprospiraceae bacterium]|nr:hypothetical protein [Saprospiraceae bacterium]
MALYNQLNQVIIQCRRYQKRIERKGLLNKEPYKSNYLKINTLLQIYTEKKVQIESIAAGSSNNSSNSVDDGLSPARERYYELAGLVPELLASEKKYFFYLQTYKIACFELLKIFDNATFKGDWPKIKNLGNWYWALVKGLESYDAAASIKKSFEDIKDLGELEQLDTKELRQLQEEVYNIQTLLAGDGTLEEDLMPEDLELLQEATIYLKENEHLLEELPVVEEEVEYEETPAKEAIFYRCKQLLSLIEQFQDEHGSRTKITELYDFTQNLKDNFNLNIEICADIHSAIEKEIGSNKSLKLKKLCKKMSKALEPFADEKYLNKNYQKKDLPKSSEIDLGIPDAMSLEDSLLIAIGKTNDEEYYE